nr:hypothetical protein [Candidatus Krumholzibacteria bacterium]
LHGSRGFCRGLPSAHRRSPFFREANSQEMESTWTMGLMKQLIARMAGRVSENSSRSVLPEEPNFLVGNSCGIFAISWLTGIRLLPPPSTQGKNLMRQPALVDTHLFIGDDSAHYFFHLQVVLDERFPIFRAGPPYRKCRIPSALDPRRFPV